MGGTQAQPRYYPVYVTVATQGVADVVGFSTFRDNRGWWVRPVYETRGVFLFTLDINDADFDYVYVNDTARGRPIRTQRAGWSGPIALSGRMHDGDNLVEIWKNLPEPRALSGTHYVVKRDGRVVLSLPARLSETALPVPGWKQIARIRLNRTKADVSVLLGWGVIHGCQGQRVLKGWQAGGDYMKRRPCEIRLLPR